MSKRALKQLSLGLMERTGLLNTLQAIGDDVGPALYVLAYHRVGESQLLSLGDPQLVNATPAQFDAQMKLVADRYRPVSAEDVLAALDGGRPLPRDAVLVTVDDGYRDFKDAIFPIASRYNIRPVLFVPTAFVGRGRFWWDRLYSALQRTQQTEIDTPIGRLPMHTAEDKRAAYGQLNKYMKQAPFAQAHHEIDALCNTISPEADSEGPATLDWDELRALARDGVTVAPHTHTHPVMSHITAEQARVEIQESQRLVAQEIGSILPIFAFPYGGTYAFDDKAIAILREEGFKIAFTMIRGRAHLKKDMPLALPRYGLSARTSLAKFHAHLTPLYDRWSRRKQ